MKKFLSWFSDTDVRNIIAIISVVGAFLMLYLIIIKPIPAGNKDTVNIAIGFIFGGLVGGVAGYYFGTSKKEEPPKQ